MTDAIAAGHAYDFAGFEIPEDVCARVAVQPEAGPEELDVDIATLKLLRAHLARTEDEPPE